MTSKKQAKNITQETKETSLKPRQNAAKRLRTNAAARDLIRTIVVRANEPDEANIALSMDLKKLKALAEKDALLGDNTWLEWATKAFRDMETNRLRIINDLVDAPDEEHRALLREHRDKGSKNVRNWRRRKAIERKKAARMASERKWIIQWAKAAPYPEAVKAWRHIKKTFNA